MQAALFAALIVGASGSMSAMESISGIQSAVTQQKAQMHANELRAMWLDYTASQHEYDEDMEVGTHAIDELQEQRSSSVLGNVYSSLDRQLKNEMGPTALLEVELQTELDKPTAAKAAGMLLEASERVAHEAESSGPSWMKAFVDTQDPRLRQAVSQAENAFRHLTNQKKTSDQSSEVADFFQHAGKTGSLTQADINFAISNPLKQNGVTGVSPEVIDEAATYILQTVDTDKDGKVSWYEALNFVQSDTLRQRSRSVGSLVQMANSKTKMAVNAQGEAIAELDRALEIQPQALIETSAHAEVAAEAKQRSEELSAAMHKITLLREAEEKETEAKKLRAQGLKKMLEMQRASLAKKEKEVRAQQKELERMDRAEKWAESQAHKAEKADSQAEAEVAKAKAEETAKLLR